MDPEEMPETQLTGLYLTKLTAEDVLLFLRVGQEIARRCPSLGQDLVDAINAEAHRRASARVSDEGIEPEPITIRHAGEATDLQLCEVLEILFRDTLSAAVTPGKTALLNVLRQLTGHTFNALRVSLGGESA